MSEQAMADALRSARTIAVVGMTDNLRKAGGYVPEYLIEAGYTVIAIHPAKTDVQGCETYSSLDDVPEDTEIDLINVFRPSEEMPDIARQALRLRPATFWMQQDLCNAEARALLEGEDIVVIEDACVMVEHRRLIGGS
jgi:predicted CoA-binding protein